jgi:mono/diheme cytochrome c family protein
LAFPDLTAFSRHLPHLEPDTFVAAAPSPLRSSAGRINRLKETKMKKTTIASLLILAVLLIPIAAAADEGAATFDAKCKSCHGADGKKIAKGDLTVAAKKPEAELVTFLTTDAKHKAKVATAADAKALITFIKTLH